MHLKLPYNPSIPKDGTVRSYCTHLDQPVNQSQARMKCIRYTRENAKRVKCISAECKCNKSICASRSRRSLTINSITLNKGQHIHQTQTHSCGLLGPMGGQHSLDRAHLVCDFSSSDPKQKLVPWPSSQRRTVHGYVMTTNQNKTCSMILKEWIWNLKILNMR